jgi:hypothetical protein
MTWTAWQYRAAFDDLYADCSEDARLSIDSRFDQLLEKGNLARRPVSAPVEDGIFELRGAKSERFLFFFGPDRRIIFVVATRKDQRALSRATIDAAKKIRAILISGKEIERAVTDSN